MRQARRFACRRVAQIFTKTWLNEEKKWFFVNTKTNTSSWDPPSVLHGDISYVHTPRTFQRRRKNGEHEFDRIYKAFPSFTETTGAMLVQRAWRRKRARLKAAERASRIFQRVLDPGTNKYYYFNTVTGVTTWTRPRVFASKQEAEAMIQTPRGFALREKAEKASALVVVDDNQSVSIREESSYASTPFTINNNGSSYIRHDQDEEEAEEGESEEEYDVGGESVDEDLPEGWESLLDQHTGQVYYYNNVSGETKWEHPED